ncbi:hypothetical protein LAZ40_09605 [Cereibacter sphaeroides]|uniref:hypothetical protein n=1 Tax=Cereibacter sphaeroides TaxID=1063 RepID=UPI001F2B67C0|nr:hypothetical protein [Cereibacter sphaeroides]MCE6959305.1 hypothetical protein [Cereibacter sphaeroides]MCE6972897.1 hypothetical protein [Cereibacter sphaeroides]
MTIKGLSSKTITFRMSELDYGKFDALAHSQGREVSELAEHLAQEALAAANLQTPEEIRLRSLKENLIRQFLELAVQIYTATPRSDITSETARQIMARADWAEAYASFMSMRDSRNLHPVLGKRVRLRLGLVKGKTYRVRRPNIFEFSTHLHPAGTEPELVDDVEDVEDPEAAADPTTD